MRIVAGEFRGRRLEAPSGKNTRPTTDRVRESLFSMVASRIDLCCANVLDAFAGSGALGLEALSRGAAHATFCEKNAKAFSVLKKNVDSLGVRNACALLQADVFSCASFARLEGRSLRDVSLYHAPRYHLIFLDPPYATAPEKIGELLRSFAGRRGDSLAGRCDKAASHGEGTGEVANSNEETVEAASNNEEIVKTASNEEMGEANSISALENGALAVYEHDKNTDLLPMFALLGGAWSEAVSKTYGNTTITLLRYSCA